MDTGTHLVMGIALGGLALIDPVVSQHPTTAQAVMAGTIIGSQSPDIDTVLKLKNNAKYIRNHRGITHSIPAIFIWPILITTMLLLFFSGINVTHVWLWTFIAVILHVFVDIFNAYGTQALRPFSRKWVALGIINTFDPFIFFAHIVALALWGYGLSPIPTFILLYSIIVVYYLVRIIAKKMVIVALKRKLPQITDYIISPTMKFNKWHIVGISDESFYVATGYKNEITIHDTFTKNPIPYEDPVMKAAFKDENLSSFLSFSPIYRWEMETYSNHIEVRFIDLRYRTRDYYPFVAVVQLDENLSIIGSYTGWIFSEKKLMSKLPIFE